MFPRNKHCGGLLGTQGSIPQLLSHPIHSWTAYKTARVFWKFIPVGGKSFPKEKKERKEKKKIKKKEKQTLFSKYFRLQEPVSWLARGSARARVDEGHGAAGAGMREAPTPPCPARSARGELEPRQALPCALAPRKGETSHRRETETCYSGTNKSAGKLTEEHLRYPSPAS